MQSRLTCSDFRSMDVDDQSIDLIATDPPYSEKFLPLWSDLASFARRVLKPTGCLVSYSGKQFLPEVMASLGEHLRYQTMISALYPRLVGQWVWKDGMRRKNVSGWKPILVYSVGPWKPKGVIKDVLQGVGYDKSLHPWQQPLNEALYLVERLTQPGDMVLDPMMGSATFGQASRLLGRNFIGCDIDPEAVLTGRKRLATSFQ